MYNQTLYDKLVETSAPDPFTGCWIWTGRRYKWGGDRKRKTAGFYGLVQTKGATGKWRDVNSHRAMWVALHGWPTRWEFVCHKCDNGLCINPDHLFLGSPKSNAEDMRLKGRDNNSQKTHCPRGHAYAEHGELSPKRGFMGWRTCLICQRERQRRRWHENPEFRARQMALRKAKRSS